MPSSTTTTTVTVRDFDADETLRAETVTVVKANLKTVTERTFDADGGLRGEKVTETDTRPTISFRFNSDGFLGY